MCAFLHSCIDSATVVLFALICQCAGRERVDTLMFLFHVIGITPRSNITGCLQRCSVRVIDDVCFSKNHCRRILKRWLFYQRFIDAVIEAHSHEKLATDACDILSMTVSSLKADISGAHFAFLRGYMACRRGTRAHLLHCRRVRAVTTILFWHDTVAFPLSKTMGAISRDAALPCPRLVPRELAPCFLFQQSSPVRGVTTESTCLNVFVGRSLNFVACHFLLRTSHLNRHTKQISQEQQMHQMRSHLRPIPLPQMQHLDGPRQTPLPL